MKWPPRDKLSLRLRYSSSFFFDTEKCFTSSVVYTQLTGGRTTRLGLKGRIAKIFNQAFIGGVGDAAWRGHNSTVIEDVTGRSDVAAHTVFIISQSHSVEFRVKPAVSSAQAVKLHQCFARHVASWSRVGETRDISCKESGTGAVW